MITQFPAVVKVSSYTEGFDPYRQLSCENLHSKTMIVLVPPFDYDYDCNKPGIEWPLTLFLPGDVKEQNPPGTEYKITVERL